MFGIGQSIETESRSMVARDRGEEGMVSYCKWLQGVFWGNVLELDSGMVAQLCKYTKNMESNTLEG